MEDLLYKNIFNDRELSKLSPDYCPSGFVLRMQMRRYLVKDTHRHGVRKNSYTQRINSHRRIPSDALIIGKEIAKIRSSYNIDNMRNKLDLKNCSDLQPNKAKDFKKIKTFDCVSYDYTDNKNLICKKEKENDDGEIDSKNAALTDTLDKVKQLSLVNGKVKDLSSSVNAVKENKSSKKRYCKSKTNNMKTTTKPQLACNNFNDSEKVGLRKVYHDKSDDYKSDSYHNSAINYPVNQNDQLIQLKKEGSEEDLQSVLIKKVILEDVDSDIKEHNVVTENSQDFVISSTDFLVSSSPIKNTSEFNFLNIIPLQTADEYRRDYLKKKYTRKWRNHIRNKKETLLQKRKSDLNIFFDKLRQKKIEIHNDPNTTKARLLVKDYSTYQHRYKVQQHIIALQKSKLEEQTKIIEQLKYNKIVEASKQSVDEMRDEVRKAYTEIDRHLRPKIKCLSNELKLHDLQEPALILHCLKVPQFLQRMEKRAREREEKHAVIRERRRQMEEERIRLKQQAELAKAQMDKEEKMRIMKELKDKRKREKIESIRKKQHAERMRALKVMADLHYERNLLAKYGFRAFVRLIEMKRDNVEKAKAHYDFQLKKNVFLNWMWHTEDMWFDRNYRAEDFRRKKLLTKTFVALKQNHHKFVLKKQVAEDYYQLYIVQLVFRKFKEGLQVIKKETEKRIQIASAYYNSNLIFRTFTSWRTLPALNALQREQEARKARWRKKVLQVVPDYTPPED